MGSFVQFTTSAFGMYLMETFGMSPSQFSAVTMAPMLTGIIFSIPAGLWADKKGVRLTVAIAGAFSIVGGFLRIISTNFSMLLISMILIGFIAVFISANCVKLISEWFPRDETSLAMGVFMAGGGAGNAIAQAITPFFGTFRNASIICLVFMIIAYVLFLAVATDRPKGAQAPPPDVPITETIGSLLKLKHIWIIGFAMVMFMVANMTTSIFLVTGLQDRGIPPTIGGPITSLFAIGIMLGSIFGGAFILKIGKNKFRIPCLIIGIIGGICLYAGWSIGITAPMAILIFIGALCCGSLVPIATAAMVYVPGMKPEYMGAGGGYMNTMRFLAAFFVPSYIIAPIVKTNYSGYLIAAAAAIVLFGVLLTLLPEVFKDKKEEEVAI